MTNAVQVEPHSCETPARDRIVRLFKFIADTYERRYPIPRRLDAYEWTLFRRDLPVSPALACATTPDGLDDLAEDPVLLRCGRPVRHGPPPAPAALTEWLGPDWSDAEADPQPRETAAAPRAAFETASSVAVAFGDDPDRIAALADYRTAWKEWAVRDRSASRAAAVYERLYELHGALEREGERYRLAVADGTLRWNRPDGSVEHPLLFRPVRLEFAPKVPEFRIVETGEPSEFFAPLFRAMPDVDGTMIARLTAEAEQLDLHPLADAELDAFLAGVASRLAPDGAFLRTDEPAPSPCAPTIRREPVFVLRERSAATVEAAHATIDAASVAETFCRALLRIVGIDRPLDLTTLSDGTTDGAALPDEADEDATVLFTKPANAEQLEIARKLERDDCVLVQGPPGTGKTHTIANLLGHLMAQGKSVLVVSHTTKALKVLGDKVVPELRPLCLSVLDSASDAGALKAAVEGIVARLGDDPLVLDGLIARRSAERDELLAEIRRRRTALLAARGDEVREIVVGGVGTRPIDAARVVAAGAGSDDWIPGPLTPGESCPLSAAESAALYRTNATVTAEDERALSGETVDLTPAPAPARVEALLREHAELLEFDRAFRAELWNEASRATDACDLEALLGRARKAMTLPGDGAAWIRRIVIDGAGPPTARTSWDGLLAKVADVRTFALESADMLLVHQPQCAPSDDIRLAEATYRSIADYVVAKKRAPGFLERATRRSWRAALDGCRVGGDRAPRLPEEFDALARAAHLAVVRDELRRRWNAQVASIGGPTLPSEEPETIAERYGATIAAALDWTERTWRPIERMCETAGLKWTLVRAEADVRYAEHDEIERLRRIVAEELPSLLAAEHARRRWDAVSADLEAAEAAAAVGRGAAATALATALARKLPDAYRRAYDELLRLQSVESELALRRDLLMRLERTAPGWAEAVRARTGPHGRPTLPGIPHDAWRFRQYVEELDRRHRTVIADLQRSLEDARGRLRTTTASLVDARAWRAQIARTSLEQQRALVGFAQATKKIGAGTGKRTRTLAAEARKCLVSARSAVPVWIMPIERAAEMFDPKTTRFDVVIVDEASQSDLSGLLACFLARQVVVVGDDEQVSPSAIGETIADVEAKIREFLFDLPEKALFDGKQSLFDVARRTFGSITCLLEHFRCVPEIIRFSNVLSYQGRIRPLREAAPDLPKPPVVPYRVVATLGSGKVNEDEAWAVAGLLTACIEQPEYAGKTFGVISLVGDEQARRIDVLLRRLLPPDVIAARRLLAGNSAQFQGDERDVVFLSLVHVGGGVPLTLSATDAMKQRFNVAASRAQDQMWVVYSLDPATELKPNDLRRRLIEHALDPNAAERLAAQAEATAESEFERAVLHRLAAAGYRVVGQHAVGAYRIDLVVEGTNGRRLAVECDGERWHRPEDLRRDIERQAVLERIGWTFERIRGSQFYRDPERAMAPVFSRLAAMEILPVGADDHDVSGDRDAVGAALLHRVRTRANEITAKRAEFAELDELRPSRRRPHLRSDSAPPPPRA